MVGIGTSILSGRYLLGRDDDDAACVLRLRLAGAPEGRDERGTVESSQFEGTGGFSLDSTGFEESGSSGLNLPEMGFIRRSRLASRPFVGLGRSVNVHGMIWADGGVGSGRV